MSANSASISKNFPSQVALAEPIRKGLGSIFEAFAKSLTINLSTYLHTSVNVRHVAIEQFPYAKFRDAESGAACCGTAQIDGIARKLLTNLPLDLVFRMIEVLLGGKPGPSNPPVNREPTEIEKQLIGVLLQRIVQDLDGAFKDTTGLRVKFVRLETESSSSQLLGPADSVVIGRFEVTLSAGEPAKIALVLPEEVGRRVLEILQKPLELTVEAVDVASQRPILELLLPANVFLEAWLEGVSMRVGDLLQLREGQVIVLDHATEHSVSCTINGDPGFAGQIVSTGKKRAFLIEDREASQPGSFAPVPGASGA